MLKLSETFFEFEICPLSTRKTEKRLLIRAEESEYSTLILECLQKVAHISSDPPHVHIIVASSILTNVLAVWDPFSELLPVPCRNNHVGTSVNYQRRTLYLSRFPRRVKDIIEASWSVRKARKLRPYGTDERREENSGLAMHSV